MSAEPRHAIPLLLLAALGACHPRTPVATTPPEPPPGIDGRYRGTARLVRGDRLCPRSGPRIYEVTGGAVTLAYSAGGRRRVPLTAAVGPDGHFAANDGTGSMDGAITNGTLEVTITSEQCEHRWTMRQVN